MRKLDEKDNKLLDEWIFMKIDKFFEYFDAGGITDYDGWGEYIYADKDNNLYVDEDNHIDFDELYKYDSSDLNRFVKKKSNKEYRLIGVFWYNK